MLGEEKGEKDNPANIAGETETLPPLIVGGGPQSTKLHSISRGFGIQFPSLNVFSVSKS